MTKLKKQPHDSDAHIGAVIDLAVQLAAKAKKNPDDFTTAYMVFQIMSDNDLFDDEPFASQVKDVARICVRAAALMPGIDEPRYSMYDYADALAHARSDLNVDKLLSLDDESFAAAMIWLATDKRETYEGLEHCQEPPEPNLGHVSRSPIWATYRESAEAIFDSTG